MGLAIGPQPGVLGSGSLLTGEHQVAWPHQPSFDDPRDLLDHPLIDGGGELARATPMSAAMLGAKHGAPI